MSRAATYACITPGLGPGFAEPEMAKPETAKPEMAKLEEPEEDDAWQFAAPFPPNELSGLSRWFGERTQLRATILEFVHQYS